MRYCLKQRDRESYNLLTYPGLCNRNRQAGLRIHGFIALLSDISSARCFTIVRRQHRWT